MKIYILIFLIFLSACNTDLKNPNISFETIPEKAKIGFPINHKVEINDLGELFTLDYVAWEDSSAWLSDSSKVFIKESNIDTLKNSSEEISSKSGRECFYVQGDITSESDRKRILSYSKSKIESIDILVTNSGGPKPGNFDDHDNVDWSDAYSLLIESTISMIRGVLPDMKERNWGRIITITSQAVKQPVEGLILSNSIWDS